MGLNNKEINLHQEKYFPINKKSADQKVIALAGNPNVGKSTVFNNLTGMHQHTGNWPGKTVASAQGNYRIDGQDFLLIDIPGAYSLIPNSCEEEIARDYICFGDPDAVIVVCDATCLERNLNLVLQVIECTPYVVVCLNMMDEAEKKGIRINIETLNTQLGVPVVPVTAREDIGLDKLTRQTQNIVNKQIEQEENIVVEYDATIEDAIALIQPIIEQKIGMQTISRWLSIRLLSEDANTIKQFESYLGQILLNDQELKTKLDQAKDHLEENQISHVTIENNIVTHIVTKAAEIYNKSVELTKINYNSRDRKMDRLLTGKKTGYPLMFALLALVFWLTITGANYPSAALASGLFWIQERLTDLFIYWNAPDWLHGALVLGVYRVLAWVVSVMLPPMAIFFPLFTLLEDAGYLPRVAYNLDKYFQKCRACGKQALTMCMGFGCNAAGVVGCRIIDSPRERLIAIITNTLVPCNGRFPTLIAIITMFFIWGSGGAGNSILAALMLASVIILGIAMTFLASKILSSTILKGIPSSFTLELPPYRKPQIGRVLIRSLLDRTLFVLGRAIKAATPAGLIIWLMANIDIGDASILTHVSGFLDPFGQAIGLDGVIILAFILGFPANEIVLPIIIMAYLSEGAILELDSLESLRELLVANGWTWVTAICTILFSLMHWPCATTCLTIKKETSSWKWTAISFITPTVMGFVICFIVANIAKLII